MVMWQRWVVINSLPTVGDFEVQEFPNIALLKAAKDFHSCIGCYESTAMQNVVHVRTARYEST